MHLYSGGNILKNSTDSEFLQKNIVNLAEADIIQNIGVPIPTKISQLNSFVATTKKNHLRITRVYFTQSTF